MKAILCLVFLGLAQLLLVSGEQLKLGDKCVTYTKKKGKWAMNIVDCGKAPDFSWDSNSKRLSVSLNGTNYCMNSRINVCKCHNITCPTGEELRPDGSCECIPKSSCRKACPEDQILDIDECKCLPKKQCRMACPPGEELNPDGTCECIPKRTCRMACPDGEELNPDGTCECIPKSTCRRACPGNEILLTDECKCVPKQ